MSLTFSYLSPCYSSPKMGIRGPASYDYAIRLDPQDFRPYQALGSVQFRQQQLQSAEDHYKKAADLGSLAPWLRFRLGRIAQKKQQYDEAIRYFEAAIALNAKSPAFHIACGEACLQQSQLKEATAAQNSHHKAIEKGSKAPQSRFHLARIAQAQGDSDAAYYW